MNDGLLRIVRVGLLIALFGGALHSKYVHSQTPTLARPVNTTNSADRFGGQKTSELSRQFFADVSDGRLDRLPLFEAALIAGGVSNLDHLTSERKRFLEICGHSSSEINGAKGHVARLNALLDCLHHKFLTGQYRSDYSQLHRTLTDGNFNCVTSTILFRCLCDHFGVFCSGVALQQHLLCAVPGSGSVSYVETTSRRWRLSNGDASGVLLPDGLAAEEVRELSDAALIGKVYYNRGVASLAEKEFAAAVMQFRFAWTCDLEDRSARTNLLATLNNWALAECETHSYSSASACIEQGLRIDRQDGPLLINDVYVQQQWVRHLCEEGQFRQALIQLQTAYERRPDVEFFDRGRVGLIARWAQYEFGQGKFAAGWAILQQAATLVGDVDFELVETTTALAASSMLMERGEWGPASRLLDEALVRHPTHGELLFQRSRLPAGELRAR